MKIQLEGKKRQIFIIAGIALVLLLILYSYFSRYHLSSDFKEDAVDAYKSIEYLTKQNYDDSSDMLDTKDYHALEDFENKYRYDAYSSILNKKELKVFFAISIMKTDLYIIKAYEIDKANDDDDHISLFDDDDDSIYDRDDYDTAKKEFDRVHHIVKVILGL